MSTSHKTARFCGDLRIRHGQGRPGNGGYLGMFPPLLLESGEAEPNRERADRHHG
jgi:hypothetical protein